MKPLSHSEAHEELADLALEPAAVDRLVRRLDAPPGGIAADALTAHIPGCRTCRAELEQWQALHGTVAEALAAEDDPIRLADLARVSPVAAPPALRAAVEAIARPGRPGAGPGAMRKGVVPNQPAPGRSLANRLSRRLLPLVAVLAVVAVAGGLLLDQSRRLDKATADAAALASVTVALDRVILDPAHRAVELRTVAGAPGGSVVWSSHDLVVLTTALAVPPADAVYRCWIERDGQRSPIGRMFFANGTGYWAGSLDAWATTSLAAGSTFGISLEPLAGSKGSPAVLAARLGS